MSNVINIRSVETSKNPVSVGEVFLIKIAVTEILSNTIQCSENSLCGQIVSGEQVHSELVFKP